MRTSAAPPRIGGVAAAELAAAYGTPLLALDLGVFDAAVAGYARAGRELGIEVSYSGKALLTVALARRLAASPLGLDVCSLGELLTAERAGFPAARLVLHGCGKSPAELAAAAAGRVGRVVVDHREELDALAAVASPARPVRVLLRVNVGIEAHVHAFVRTAGDDSKFGFAPAELAAAARAALAAPGLELAGVHTHLGSQILELEPYLQGLEAALDALAAVRACGAAAPELVLGGGFGVDPHGRERFDAAAALAAIAARLGPACAARGLAPPRLGVEPGRSIVADAGTSLYTVVAVKRRGARRFAIVDGGLADNPRPALYGAHHGPSLAGRASEAEPVETTVCGRSCENDELVTADLPADLAPGDLLSLAQTGAYTYAMASNYNRFGKPAVAFALAGAHRLAVRRQRPEDVLRDDVDDAAADAAWPARA